MFSEVIELTKDMVAIPSVNPQDKSPVKSPYGESQMADFIYNWLGKNNLNPQRQQIEPSRANITATVTGKDKTKTLLLSGHMDTVDVKKMTIDPFDPQIKDNHLSGRGSCDTKGPLAAMLLAFRDRANQGDLPCNLTFLATCGEEFNALGSIYYAQNTENKPAAAIFAEPTGLKVVAAHKGIVRLMLTCTGKSAHSATPQLGDNAVYTMNKAILAVQLYNKKLSSSAEHLLLGTETLSLTMIQGGRQVNIIPDQCTAKLDWRTLPGHNPKLCRDELQNALAQVIPPEKMSLDIMSTYNSMHTDPSAPLIQTLLDAAEKITNDRRIASVPYATDASAFTNLNIPMAIFGPGNPAQAHTADEFIEIDQLEKSLAAYKNFLNSNWGVK